MKAIVVGAGIAGIAAAIRLAVKGYAVEVFEANGGPGGKLSKIELGGFRFDAGPSLFTMPHLVDELFELAGRKPSEHFEYQRLDLACKYHFADGMALDGHADSSEFAKEIERKLEVPAKVVEDYFARAEMKYRHTRGVFLERSLHKLSTYLRRETLVGVLNLYRLGIFKTLDKENQRLLQHPRLVQLFNRYATYNGSNPYATPGIMSMIPHLEHGMGAAFPTGGMYSITESLHELAVDLGVDFHFDRGVERILVEHKKAVGVQVGGERRPADVVVSNVDVVPAYRKLMPDQAAPEKTLEHERSSSALIFYWGMGREFPRLDLHNIFFSADYREEFRCIFETGEVSADPTVYVNIASKYSSGDAPAGKEAWFVMVNVPCDTGQDWERIRGEVRENVVAKLSQMLRVDIGALIEVEDYLDPLRIAAKTGSFRGALYGAASNDRMAAFLRHPNFNRRIRNLFFCGGSVHPGGGIPLCLLSAKIVDDLVGNPVEREEGKQEVGKEALA